MKPISVAVTGATGFVGARLINCISERGEFKPVALVRNKARARHVLPGGVTLQEVQLSDRQALERALADIDVVVNAAYDMLGRASGNLADFQNLLDACVAAGVQRVVQVSSIAVYDDWPAGRLDESAPSDAPGSAYKETKAAMEKMLCNYAKNGSLQTVILQPTIIYGPESRLWTDYPIEQLLTGTIVLPDDGQGLCPAVYIDDVVSAINLSIKTSTTTGQRYIISGPSPVTWHEFFDKYRKIIGKGEIKYIPYQDLAIPNSQAPRGNDQDTKAPPPTGTAAKEHLISLMRGMIGQRNITKLRRLVLRINRLRGSRIYYPDPFNLELYRSKGHCSIEKAKAELGYQPKFDFDAGCRAMEDYIRKIAF